MCDDSIRVCVFSTGCGGVIHADSGIIKSPNYPQNFPASVECSWQIVVHEGNHVEMSFDADFQIPDDSGSCRSSYVKVPQTHLRFLDRRHFNM